MKEHVCPWIYVQNFKSVSWKRQNCVILNVKEGQYLRFSGDFIFLLLNFLRFGHSKSVLGSFSRYLQNSELETYRASHSKPNLHSALLSCRIMPILFSFVSAFPKHYSFHVWRLKNVKYSISKTTTFHCFLFCFYCTAKDKDIALNFSMLTGGAYTSL